MKAFQLRSRAVRAASQELMRRLREDRAAVSRHARKAVTVAAPAPTAPTAPAAVSDIKPSRKILRSAAPASPPVEALLPVVEVKAKAAPKPRKPKAKPAPEPVAAEATPSIEAAATPAARPRPRKKAATPVLALQEALAETFAAVGTLVEGVAAAAAETISADHAAKSVSAVPTLGPGMVWRLNQLGVATLGDLAAQDAEALRRQLGRLGRMVNVDQWIAYARRG
jgi:predicted flap endonuclease-1-like 5' DNA nuclease